VTLSNLRGPGLSDTPERVVDDEGGVCVTLPPPSSARPLSIHPRPMERKRKKKGGRGGHLPVNRMLRCGSSADAPALSSLPSGESNMPMTCMLFCS
jgi:hypothetical protein